MCSEQTHQPHFTSIRRVSMSIEIDICAQVYVYPVEVMLEIDTCAQVYVQLLEVMLILCPVSVDPDKLQTFRQNRK